MSKRIPSVLGLCPQIAATNLAFASAITVIGIFARSGIIQPGGHDLRLAFVLGATLACFVTVRFYWFFSLASHVDRVGLCVLARHLSRLVYLTLYCLVGEAALLSCWAKHSLALYSVQLQSHFCAGLLARMLIHILVRLLSGRADFTLSVYRRPVAAYIA